MEPATFNVKAAAADAASAPTRRDREKTLLLKSRRLYLKLHPMVIVLASFLVSPWICE